ncbi:hypothetical protein KP509_13G055800 [Ceratopteris richardii]|uniref:Uncharacterized protein n=1 Tax=Ceratopteris richardii TaxID=49495 RepID=A0A8T2TDQ3_CERRI|nr:hypothetical protein KP509_13G055800 [Ceratopteris richardii]
MERTEPSFIPQWLKGTGGGGSAIHNSSDEGSYTRSKGAQQQITSSLDSPRKSLSSSKAFSSASRRVHSTNNAVDRQSSERDHFLTRSKSGLNRSNRSSKLNLEQNGYNSWIDGEYGHEVDRDFYARKKDWLSGMVSEGRDKDKEVSDSTMWQHFPSGLPGKYDHGSKLKRSQSIGLSSSSRVTDVVSVTSPANGNASMTAQKAVFEHNFPSLGSDDKQSSPRSNSISSPRPSVNNPNLVWQGATRSELSRASSPGLAGGYVNPMTSVTAAGVGNDMWSSALADAPNGNIQSSTSASSAVPPVGNSQTPSFVCPLTSAAPLNMAEALTQNPPRVRTPPQVSLESQRLEELALRQSRQLIPMTPSLPKTMSLADKTKSKSSRTADGSVTSSKLQLNPSQKPLVPSKSENSKPSQGKLLVLKSGKDGGLVMTTTLKSDGTVVPQSSNQGVSAVSAGSSTLGQRKQSADRKGTYMPDGSRVKDSAFFPEEKRMVLHAQNRSDFFNALRKKASENGVSANASISQPKIESLNLQEDVLLSATTVDNHVIAKGNGAHCNEEIPQLEGPCNGEIGLSSENGSAKDVGGNEVLLKEESRQSLSSGDLEEKEAEFMRSLGWEENEAVSELTEEEINAFYQVIQK